MFSWLIHRPYVTLFLLAFLWLAGRRFGAMRTLIWLASGYLIALASEASSIRTGFPYGWYFYKYEHLTRDPLVFGVPFWDSLSYPFLAYAGFSMAETLVRGARWKLITAGAALTMLLDMMIDPVAHLGDRWFLGEIYGYAHPGAYFGIPVSNFAGWFLVAWCIIGANALVWRALPARIPPPPTRLDHAYFFGIALFNIAIAFTVGAWWLGLCSTGLTLAIAAALWHTRNPWRILGHTITVS